MTSQVAVLNQRGVAVASDTVVTVSTTEASGLGALRTYSNRTKIHPLGPAHKVVIAHSGNGSVDDVDVALLIAEWGRACPDPHDSLSAYVTDLRSWIDSGNSPISEDSQVTSATRCLVELYSWVRRRSELLRGFSTSKRSISKYPLEDFVQSLFDRFTQFEEFPGASATSDQEWLDEVDLDIDGIINGAFQSDWEHLKSDLEEARPVLQMIAPLVLSRNSPVINETGLAIIGYGTSDLHPRAVNLGFRGRYANLARISVDDEFVHEDGIFALAQSDAIQGFMKGASDEALATIKAVLRDRFKTLSEQWDGLSELEESFLREAEEEWEERLADEFHFPLLSTVKFLAVRDLAELAESLVGVQALRANASPELPTVGGFIESLVIDRYEGVRWINRLPR